jgi:hypothetical protein
MDSLVRQDSLVLQDPVAYVPLPSAPQPSAPPADTVVTVRPEPLTFRLVSVHTAAPIPPVAINRKWLAYCCFIIIVVLFGIFAFYTMLYGGHKN